MDLDAKRKHLTLKFQHTWSRSSHRAELAVQFDIGRAAVITGQSGGVPTPSIAALQAAGVTADGVAAVLKAYEAIAASWV